MAIAMAAKIVPTQAGRGLFTGVIVYSAAVGDRC
jgi:hypothetical protein